MWFQHDTKETDGTDLTLKFVGRVEKPIQGEPVCISCKYHVEGYANKKSCSPGTAVTTGKSSPFRPVLPPRAILSNVTCVL